MVAEAQDKAYEAIEIAKKTGKIKKGANEVTKAVERNSAKLVVVAQDTEPKEVIMHLAPLCKEKNIPFIEVPSKTDLGTAASLKVPTTAVTIVKEGDAKALIEELSK
tara:strand:- start:8172 stop:8492 length:321 start_codon:yes stop_codon:yes gene_type:complete